MGLTGPNIIPYVSSEDGEAIPGQSKPDWSDQNQRLAGAWLSSFILARRAGLKIDFPREYSDWQSRAVVLLPSPLIGTQNSLVHVHTDFWEKARQYVSNGGFLYASLSTDAAIPEMQDLFGTLLVDHAAVSEVTLKVVEPFSDLKPGDTFRYSAPTSYFKHWAAILEVQGGKVIAVDQDNRPALVANVRGAGKTLLCAYPLESYLAETPSAFEKPESTYGIYKAFLDWAGVKVLFRSDQPSVEVSALRADRRGYAVLVSHSAVALPVTVTTRLSVKSLRLITPRGPQAISLEGKSWKMVVTPYEGAIVEWDLAGM